MQVAVKYAETVDITHSRSFPLERTRWTFARKDGRIVGWKIRVFKQSVLPLTLRFDLVVGLALQLHGWSRRTLGFAAAVSCAPAGLGPSTATTYVGLDAVSSGWSEAVRELAEVISASAAAAVRGVLGDSSRAARTVNNRACRLHRALPRLYSLQAPWRNHVNTELLKRRQQTAGAHWAAARRPTDWGLTGGAQCVLSRSCSIHAPTNCTANSAIN